MHFTEFERAVPAPRGGKSVALKPLYLFHGPEAFFKQSGLARLRHALGLKEPGMRVDGAEAVIDRVLDELFTLPFFGAGTKFVILEGAETFFSDHEKVLRKVYAAPPSTSVLALVAGKLPKNSRLIKWVDEVGAAVDCAALAEDARVSWIRARAKEKGKPIDAEAADFLARRVDGGLLLLDGHLEKLVLFAAGRAEITKTDVEALVGTDKEYVNFDLVAAVASRRKAQAIEILHTLLRDSQGLEGIIGALAWQYRQLLQGEMLLRSGASRAQAGAQLKLGYRQQEFFGRLAQFRPGELRRKYRLLGRHDRMAKTSALPQETLSELLVVQLMEA